MSWGFEECVRVQEVAKHVVGIHLHSLIQQIFPKAFQARPCAGRCWGYRPESDPGSALKKLIAGTSLAVQGLGLRTSTAVGTGSIPGQGTKIPHAVWYGQKKKKKETYSLLGETDTVTTAVREVVQALWEHRLGLEGVGSRSFPRRIPAEGTSCALACLFLY